MIEQDKHFLEEAILQAEKSIEQGGFPAGAVLVKDNKIISSGVSLGFKLNDPTSHSETVSIREACSKLQTTNLENLTLYASLQPCLMCFSVANWAGVSRIVFACRKTDEMASKGYYEGKNDIVEINKKNNRQIILDFIPDFEQKSLELVKKWENLQK
jgi:tRNA(Arg) A34 adenosine deaminase TadA